MFARVASFIALLAVMMLPRFAAGAPGRVKVFEAQAHAAASASSRVVKVFAEGAEVSVSEQSENGWRRVRLPSGKTAFVRDEDITLDGAQDAPPAPPLAEPMVRGEEAKGGLGTTDNPPPVVEGKPINIYVKDLNHFAELVKEDPLVSSRANSMVRQRTIGLTGLAVGLAAGTLISVAALTFLAGQNCTSNSSGTTRDGAINCTYSPRLGLASVGFGIAIGGAIFPWIFSPSRNDLLDTINLWNGRHPNQQFEITHAPAQGK